MLTINHTGSGSIFYATHSSAGFDICSNENYRLMPNEYMIFTTGLFIVDSKNVEIIDANLNKIVFIPEIQIRPRSGLAINYGITLLNSPSTIDSDYRGEIKVILINHSSTPFLVREGDRIAQGVCTLVFQVPGIEVKNQTRGMGGFGSTGKN